MNANDIERHCESVASEPQPAAPASLRAFVANLEFVEAAKATPHRVIPFPATSGRVFRGAAALAAIAATLVIAVGGTALVASMRGNGNPAGSAGSSEPTMTPSESQGPTKPIATPAAVAEPFEIGGWTWSSVDAATLGGVTPAQPVVLGDRSRGYVAGCWDNRPNAGQRGLLCRSDDGLHWTYVDKDFWMAAPATMAEHAGVLVAAGFDQASKPEVLTSTDGVIWTRVPLADIEGAAHSPAMTSVVAGPAGCLGWGEQASAGITLWHSADGRRWNLVASPVAHGQSLTVEAGKYFLTGLPDAAGSHPLVYYSTDGLTWTQADTSAASTSSRTEAPAIEARPDGSLVGLFTFGTSHPIRSTDGGLTWLDWTSDGLTYEQVAGAWFRIEPASDKTSSSISTDGGRTWTPLAPNGRRLGALAWPLGDGIVLNDADGRFWLGRPM